MQIDWIVMGWLLLLAALTIAAAAIGRLAGWLFCRATGSRVSRRRGARNVGSTPV